MLPSWEPGGYLPQEGFKACLGEEWEREGGHSDLSALQFSTQLKIFTMPGSQIRGHWVLNLIIFQAFGNQALGG